MPWRLVGIEMLRTHPDHLALLVLPPNFIAIVREGKKSVTTTATITFICISPVLHFSILFYACLNYFLDNMIFFLFLFHRPILEMPRV